MRISDWSSDVCSSDPRFGELRAMGRVTLRPRAVNWKIVGDNYADALHVAVAHPGLRRLMGAGYRVEAAAHADRMRAQILRRPSANLSEIGRALCRARGSQEVKISGVDVSLKKKKHHQRSIEILN